MSDNLDKIYHVASQFVTTSEFMTFARSSLGLKLDAEDVTMIIENHSSSVKEQRWQILELWTKKNGLNATPQLMENLIEHYYASSKARAAMAASKERLEDVFHEIVAKIPNQEFRRFARLALLLTGNDIATAEEDKRGSVNEFKNALLWKWRYSQNPNTEEADVIRRIRALVDDFLHPHLHETKQQSMSAVSTTNSGRAGHGIRKNEGPILDVIRAKAVAVQEFPASRNSAIPSAPDVSPMLMGLNLGPPSIAASQISNEEGGTVNNYFIFGGQQTQGSTGLASIAATGREEAGNQFSREQEINCEIATIIYNPEEQLGKRVYKAKKKHSLLERKDLAVKLCHIDKELSDEDEKTFLNEIRIAIKLQHHINVCRYIDHTICKIGGERNLVIVTELCSNQKLETITDDLEQKKTMIIQICYGLEHMHEQNIAHRDIKPDNILLSLDEKNMKIADFGISKDFSVDVKKKTLVKTGISGTFGWIASEMCSSTSSKKFEDWVKADTYSLGLVTFHIFTDGKHPYEGEEIERHIKITRKERPGLTAIKTKKNFFDRELLLDLLKDMLGHEPDKRPKITEILQHPFLWTTEKKMNFIHDANRYIEIPLDEGYKGKMGLKDLQVNGTIEQRMAYVAYEQVADRASSTSSDDSVGFCHPEGATKENKGTNLSEPRVTDEEKEVLMGIHKIIKNWIDVVEEEVKEDINAHSCREYVNSLTDLVRYIRNIHEYFDQQSNNVKQAFGTKNEGLWKFFASRFPEFFIYLFNLLKNDLRGDDRKKYLEQKAEKLELKLS